MSCVLPAPRPLVFRMGEVTRSLRRIELLFPAGFLSQAIGERRICRVHEAVATGEHPFRGGRCSVRIRRKLRRPSESSACHVGRSAELQVPFTIWRSPARHVCAVRASTTLSESFHNRSARLTHSSHIDLHEDPVIGRQRLAMDDIQRTLRVRGVVIQRGRNHSVIQSH